MRFSANGPSIPDDLLVARDEGRVVFFCGAGVSRARAELSDFFELAHKVMESLGVTPDNQAKKILDEARKVEKRTGVSGLISIDKVFGFLERDFLSSDIESSVAKILKPNPTVDVSAHQVILDLARGPDGKSRLVTTNFDLLFESCDCSLQSWTPPRLPDPQNQSEFHGIIHLHGRVDDTYSQAYGDGFVLSSAAFGKAYLADGWATRFIRTILERYAVVFIGYAADDPPVQYLLEALNGHLTSRAGVYAFQSANSQDAPARWRQKGVQPIEYDEGQNHRALWETLTAWAIRAQDPDAWHENVIALARRGPDAMLPFERGQVAHIVSTLFGSKKFATAAELAPASWLCVFDPAIRYSMPTRVWDSTGQNLIFDPFDVYCLDSDPIPPKSAPDNYFAKREIPENVWDCFAAARVDRDNLREDHFVALRGHWATHEPRLPSRLAQLGIWIARVSNQAVAVWWASGQSGLHPDIQSDIQFQLELGKISCSTPVRQAWRYVFEAWEHQTNGFNLDLHELKGGVRLDGWTNAAVRKLARINRPYLTATRHASSPKPLEDPERFRVQDLVNFDVKYPNSIVDIKIPDEFILPAVREFRKNLEFAVSLEKELGSYGLEILSPLEPDPGHIGDSIERTHGISALLLIYASLFKRLTDHNPDYSRAEALAWPTDDETVFTRLRIWACGDPRIFAGFDVGELICGVNDRAFWQGRNQRDLLLALSKRWSYLQSTHKTKLEAKLLLGPPRWDDEGDREYSERSAGHSLTRIHWLRSQGCVFGFDFGEIDSKLRQRAPRWQPQYANNAVDSRESRGGWVTTDTDFSQLLNVPLAGLLDRAKELSGRTNDLLVETNPYAGLSVNRPVRAFSALAQSSKLKVYPDWAWKTFLNSDARKSDKPKLSAYIAERVSRLPPDVLGSLIHPVCDWLLTASGPLLRRFPRSFEGVWERIVSSLEDDQGKAHSSIVRGARVPDWAMEALNSPVGKLAQALMTDPQLENLQPRTALPRPWITKFDKLLSLSGDLHCHAQVILAYRLNWLYAIDPAWTKKNLVAVLDRENDDQESIWAGVFWRAEIPTGELFLFLKSRLLELAERKSLSRRTHGEVLAGFLLAGWASKNRDTGERYVSHTEMRGVLANADEEFRLHTLWQIRRWVSEGTGESASWDGNLSEFFTDAWPLQTRAKSARITDTLCDLAMSNTEKFLERVDIILPLVTTIDHNYIGLHMFLDSVDQTNAMKMLALVSKVLPVDAAMWPYGISELLERLSNAVPESAKDFRLIELKRRWNSR